MKSLSNIQRWLLGTCICAVLAMVIMPGTRWYAVQEIMSILSHSGQTQATIYQRVQVYAASHPSDYLIQLADVLLFWYDAEDNSTDNVRKFYPDSLVARFPSRPSAYAEAVRAESEYFANPEWKYQENVEFDGEPSSNKTDSPMPNQKTIHLIKDCLRLCKSGELVDPNNAYFPAVAAGANFTIHQDGNAIAALNRCQLDTDWNDYSYDNELAVRRVAVLSFGADRARNSVEIDSRIDGSVPSACFESVARMAVWIAKEDELSGRQTSGMRIRRSVIHIGSLIWCKGGNFEAYRCGMDIVRVAFAQPGGAPSLRVDADGKLLPSRVLDEYNSMLFESFSRYLIKHHDPAEVSWLEQEELASSEMSNKMLPKYGSIEDVDYDHDCLATAAGIMALSWLILALMFWIVSSSVCKLIDSGYRKDICSAGNLIAIFAAMIVVLVVTTGITVLPGRLPILEGIMYVFGAHSDRVPWITPVIVILPLLLFAAGAVLYATERKLPVVYTVVNSYRSVALPLVTVFVVIYCVALVCTMRCDDVLNGWDGNYSTFAFGARIALLTHEPWPVWTPQPPLPGDLAKGR